MLSNSLRFYYYSVLSGIVLFGMASILFKAISSVELVLLVVGILFFYFLYTTFKLSLNSMVDNLVNKIYIKYGTLIYLMESIINLKKLDLQFKGLSLFFKNSINFVDSIFNKWIKLVKLNIKIFYNVLFIRLFFFKKNQLITIDNKKLKGSKVSHKNRLYLLNNLNILCNG